MLCLKAGNLSLVQKVEKDFLRVNPFFELMFLSGGSAAEINWKIFLYVLRIIC